MKNRLLAHRLRGAGRGGFSLLELVVASALLVVIMLGLLAMFYQTERAFRLGVVQADTLEGGRTTMELVTRDFSELGPADDTNAISLHVNIGVQGVDQVLAVDDAGAPVEFRTNVFQPFFLIKRENGIIKGVRYDFKDNEIATGVATLYRMEVAEAASQELALSQALFANDVNTAPDLYGRIVDGVVSLNVRAYDELGNLIPNFPLSTVAGPFFAYDFNSGLVPFSVEVELGFMEKKTLERANALTPLNRARFISEHAAEVHLFRQRVPIRSAQPTTPFVVVP